jgi:hypothetical protein
MSYAVFRDGDQLAAPLCERRWGYLKMYRAVVDQFKCLMDTVRSSLATPNF